MLHDFPYANQIYNWRHNSGAHDFCSQETANTRKRIVCAPTPRRYETLLGTKPHRTFDGCRLCASDGCGTRQVLPVLLFYHFEAINSMLYGSNVRLFSGVLSFPSHSADCLERDSISNLRCDGSGAIVWRGYFHDIHSYYLYRCGYPPHCAKKFCRGDTARLRRARSRRKRRV